MLTLWRVLQCMTDFFTYSELFNFTGCPNDDQSLNSSKWVSMPNLMLSIKTQYYYSCILWLLKNGNIEQRLWGPSEVFFYTLISSCCLFSSISPWCYRDWKNVELGKTILSFHLYHVLDVHTSTQQTGPFIC